MIAYNIFFFLLLIVLLRYAKLVQLPNSSKWLMPIGFSVKILVSLFFLYIYSYHYGVGELTEDPHVFLSESKLLNDVFSQSPVDYFKLLFSSGNEALVHEYLMQTTQWDSKSTNWIIDSRNMLRINSLIHFFSFGSTFIHLAIFSLIGFLGIRLITITISPFSKLKMSTLFLVLLLAPNVLFWSSGILKEPIIVFNIGLFLYTVLGHFSVRKKFVLGLITLFCMLCIKPYILLCILPAGAIYLLVHRVKNKAYAIGLSVGLILLGITSLLTNFMKPVVEKISFKQFDFINISKGGIYARADTCIYIFDVYDLPFMNIDSMKNSVVITKPIVCDYIIPNTNVRSKKTRALPNKNQPWKIYYNEQKMGSFIEVTPIKHSAVQLIKNIPQAINNVWFRPFPSDPPVNQYKWLSLMDVWLLNVTLFLTVFFYRRKIERKELNLVVGLFVFAFTLTLLIGWTTPTIGAIIRYKIPIQLAVMLMILIMFNPLNLSSTKTQVLKQIRWKKKNMP